MAKLGTEKKPAIVCVQDEHRAEEVASIFDKKKIWGQGLISDYRLTWENMGSGLDGLLPESIFCKRKFR